jgi:hypothetical protein
VIGRQRRPECKKKEFPPESIYSVACIISNDNENYCDYWFT